MTEIYISPTEELIAANFLVRKNQINAELTAAVDKLWPNEKHKNLAERLHTLDKSGKITLPNAVRCWDNDVRNQLVNSIPSMATVLVIHYILATVYNSRVTGRLSDGANSALFIQAAYHLGALQWHIEAFEIQNRIKARAIRGGKGKSKLNDPFRAEIIARLLTPPQDGWPSLEKTAGLLLLDLEAYIAENGVSIRITNLFEFIENEISNGVARILYERAKKHKQSTSAPPTPAI